MGFAGNVKPALAARSIVPSCSTVQALRSRHAATNTVYSPAASSLGSCHRQKASFLNVLVSRVTRNYALPARAAAHQRASGKT